MRLLFVYTLLIISSNLFAQNVLVGAYYFDGWSGTTPYQNSIFFTNNNTPSHVTDKLYLNFPEREPIWGWRDDDVKIMEKQIDLAADNGIDFFMFCWYYQEKNKHIDTVAIQNLSLNTSLNLFLKAKNKHRVKFSILIANHEGFEIDNKEGWIETIQFLSKHYFCDQQYLSFENKPVLDFFDSPSAHKYINSIRETVKSNGYKNLCYFSNGKFYSDCEINGWYNIREKESGQSTKRNYQSLISYVESCWWKSKDWNVVPIVMAGWDKRPWELKETTIFYTNRTPRKFGRHFRNALLNVKKCNPIYKLVMIYAWNELGEGGYIVPTKGDKKALYLKQIKKIRKQLKL